MKKLMLFTLCLAAVISVSGCKGKTEEEQPENTTVPVMAAVEREYSTAMRPLREVNLYSDARGEIVECSASEGDFVEEGQLLYRIDDNGIYDNIATTKNSIAKANLTISTAAENEANLNIYAPSSGILKNFNIKEGERVNTGTIAKISDESGFVARVPFNKEQLNSIKVGMAAQIVSDDMMSGVSAKVSRIYSERNTSVNGAVLYDVELKGTNPGTLNEGMAVSAVINGIQSPVSGYIDENDGLSVVSRSSGNAGKIYVSDGQYVKKGTLIMTIDNSNVTATAQRARIDKNDLEIKLRSLERDAEELLIYAPMSGIVTEKKKDVRDSVASKSDSVMTIADISVLVMDITLGEDTTVPTVGTKLTVEYSGGTAEGIVASAEGSTIHIEIKNDANIASDTIGTIKL